MNNYFKRYCVVLILLILVIISCQNGKKEQSGSPVAEIPLLEKHHFEFNSPLNNGSIKCNEPVIISLQFRDSSKVADSVRLFIDSKYYKTLKESKFTVEWKQTALKVGTRRISADAFFAKGKVESSALNINLVSNIVPKEHTYKIIKIYPHDAKAYTQGLVYENGILYESTGEYGQSSLRKIKLSNYEVFQSISLDDKVFAEGIALVGNEIYQITWRERTCFVYNKETFQLLRKLTYDFDEGWGLTWDGQRILMTDGSNSVYFLDTSSFNPSGKVEVMDDKGSVDKLNELEYVKGSLFANVYMKDIVVIIEPQTGRVTGKIDFKDLLKPGDKGPDTDVLNGIAWNPSNRHFYITGKNWPKLFEIEISGF